MAKVGVYLARFHLLGQASDRWLSTDGRCLDCRFEVRLVMDNHPASSDTQGRILAICACALRPPAELGLRPGRLV